MIFQCQRSQFPSAVFADAAGSSFQGSRRTLSISYSSKVQTALLLFDNKWIAGILLVLRSTEATVVKDRIGLCNDGGKCEMMEGSVDLPALSCCVLITSMTRKLSVWNVLFFLPLKRVLKVRLVWWIPYSLHTRARVSAVNTFWPMS